MTKAEAIFKFVKTEVTRFWNQVHNRRNFRYFLYYALGNFVLLILWTVFQRLSATVDLSLKPATTDVVQGNWLLWVFAVSILPLSLLLEELGFRFMPKFFIKDLYHLDTITISEEGNNGFREVKHNPVRWWIYHHWIESFIIVSALWSALIHQLNVVESSPICTLIYFGVQLFSGVMLARIYIYRGLGASWAVHVSWDLFLVFLGVIFSLISL